MTMMCCLQRTEPNETENQTLPNYDGDQKMEGKYFV